MTRVSFIIKSHVADDDDPLIGGAAKNPYRILKYLAREVDVPTVVYFEGSHSGREPYRAIRTNVPLLKLYAKTVWQNLASLPAVWSAFRRSQVVQCHHPHYGFGAALLRRWVFGNVRFVVKAHGTAVPEARANRYRGIKGVIVSANARLHWWHDRFVLAQADRILCSSRFQQREMTELYGIPADRLETIYNGYDAEILRRAADGPRSERREPSEHFVFCGRVVPKKGLLDAVALFQAVSAGRPADRLTLVLGRRSEIEDPATYREVQAAIAGDNRIEIRHDVAETDLYRIFVGATIGLVPSNNYESIPTVVIEMIAAGVAVFATYRWGVPEVLPTWAGLEGDLQRDVATIRDLLTDRDRVAKVAAARRAIERDLSCSELVRSYARVYRSLGVGGRTSTAGSSDGPASR